MVTLTIDRKKITVPEGTTILDAAKSAGIPIPNLCYLRDVNEIGACRVCVVEMEGKDKLITACNNKVEEGMVLYTNSPKVREVHRTNVEFILSHHDSHCASCVRSGNCSLQTIANDLGITSEPYQKVLTNMPWKRDFPMVRDYAKCIKCMRCVQICEKVQSLNVWDISNTGSRTTVDVSHNRRIEDADCSLCGQCITHCPVGALRERDDTQKMFDVLADPDKITVVQVAPAVRAAWGEALGLPREKATMGRLVAAMRRIGFDHIFDTNFSADLTIMEEGTEFLARLKNHSLDRYPMFTSCCPGWVRFVKSNYPEFTPNLSTAKSPQQMFGAVAKSYFAEKKGLDPHKVRVISIMPCLAKKAEAALEPLRDACGDPDVDVVLTTRELIRMVRADKIVLEDLPEEEFDRRPPSTSPRLEWSGWRWSAAWAAPGSSWRPCARARYSTTSWRSWPVPAAAPEAADSPSWTAWSLPSTGAALSGTWTRTRRSASATRTPTSRPSTGTTWRSPAASGPTICSTPTTTRGGCPSPPPGRTDQTKPKRRRSPCTLSQINASYGSRKPP